MSLLKIIIIIFLIYFIRRFFQLYAVMKRVQQEAQMRQSQAGAAQAGAAQDLHQQATAKKQPPGNVIEADFKVVK